MSNINVNNITPLVGNSGTVSISGSLTVKNDVTLGGTINIGDATTDSAVFSAEVSSSVIPDADNTYNLGSAAKTWGWIYANTGSFNHIATSGSSILSITSASIGYLSGSSPIIVGAAMVPDLHYTHNLGSSAMQWNQLFIAEITSSGTYTDVSASVNIIPGKDDWYNLGNSSYQWANLYVDRVAYVDALGASAEDTDIAYIRQLSGSSAKPNITSSVNIVPKYDNKYDLGSSTHEWKDLFVDGVGYIDSLGASAQDTTIAYIKQLSGSSLSAGAAHPNSSITSSVNIVPGRDDIYSLGSAQLEWKDLFVDGTANLDVISAGTLTLNQDIQSAAALDASYYSINGKRGEIRSQLQAGVAVDTGWTLELRNTSIATTSLIVSNVIGGDGGIVTGSVVTANTVAASTASFNFYNTGNAQIQDNARFTASFAIF